MADRRSLLLRSVLATLYGALAGVVWAYAATLIFHLDPLVFWIVGGYFVAACALLGGLYARIVSLTPASLALMISVAPILIFYMVVVMGVVAVVMLGVLALSPVFMLLAVRDRRRFMEQMRSAGRLVTRQELLPKLAAGEGTLIAKFHLKGFESLWWTPDNLDELGYPCIRLEVLADEYPDTVVDAMSCDNKPARCCDEKYLDHESGEAALLPWATREWKRLARDYPEHRLMIVPWGHGDRLIDDELEDDEEVVPPAIGE